MQPPPVMTIPISLRALFLPSAIVLTKRVTNKFQQAI
jgi:hypothetical protein